MVGLSSLQKTKKNEPFLFSSDEDAINKVFSDNPNFVHNSTKQSDDDIENSGYFISDRIKGVIQLL